MTNPIHERSVPHSQQPIEVQRAAPAGVGSAPTTMTAAPKEKGYILSAFSAIIDFFKKAVQYIFSFFRSKPAQPEKRGPLITEEVAIMRAFERLSQKEQAIAYSRIAKEASYRWSDCFKSWEALGREKVKENPKLLKDFVTPRAIEEEQG